MNTATIEAIDDMIDTAQPDEWLSWLFDLQTEMIARGHFEAFTGEGCRPHAEKMYLLKTFFESLKPAQ